MCTRPFNIPYTGCVRSTNLESVEISSDKNFEISKIRHLVSFREEEWKKSHDLYEIEIRRKLENCVFSIATLLPRYEDSFGRALVKLRIKCEKMEGRESRRKDDGDFPSIHQVYIYSVGVRPFAARFHGAARTRPPADNSAGAVRVTVTMQSTVETYRSIIPKLIFITRVPGRWRMAAHLSRPRSVSRSSIPRSPAPSEI